jgi:ligand-binding sensor domain-containing protein
MSTIPEESHRFEKQQTKSAARSGRRSYTQERFSSTADEAHTMPPTRGRPVKASSVLLGALARTVGVALAVAVLGTADLPAERLPIQTYNTSNGLAHDRIRSIVPDSRGFLWFCTADGLSRFDGRGFVNYGLAQGLPHPSVEEIVEVGPGLYWVATVGGLARLIQPAPALAVPGI